MWSAVEGSGEGGGGGGPCARAKHSCALLGGYVYVLGGRGEGGSVPLRDFWRYCLATGEWEQLECRGDAPPSLQEHSCTAHGARLYVFGGEAGCLGETPLWVYDTELGSWRKLPGQAGRRSRPAPAAPRGRRGHSAHALKDCLLVYGGYKDLRGSTNELWAFHYETESWHQVRTASAGPARHRHAAALHDARLYVHGGQSDLRAAADLWHYDTMSRVWTMVRTRGPGPGARAGHAGLRAGAHFYVFGGEADGHPAGDLWRFHFATETWERIAQSSSWPAPRVDACALLTRTAPRAAPLPSPRAPAPPAPPAPHARPRARFPFPRCSYSALDHDSTESLALSKSQSSYMMRDPSEADEAGADVSREPISVPDFADMVLPTPVLSPTEITRLVYLEDEEHVTRANEDSDKKTVVIMPKSASVRFRKEVADEELSTSDYASAERVNRLSATSFCNPHYLGPDVNTLAFTPDSGIELQDMSGGGGGGGGRGGRGRAGEDPPRLYLLLVGGRETPRGARRPLPLWTYRLL